MLENLYWNKNQENFEKYYTHFSNMIVRMQDFDFSYKFPQQSAQTIFDFVASGLNIVNEELEEKAFQVQGIAIRTFIELLGIKDVSVIITDNKGIIRFIYKDETLFNMSIPTGSHISTLLTNTSCLIEKLKEDGDLDEFISIMNKKGEVIKVNLSARLVQNHSGLSSGAIYTIKKQNNQDISFELKRISHDIMSPLSSVNMLTDIFTEDIKNLLDLSSKMQTSTFNLIENIRENFLTFDDSQTEKRLINFHIIIGKILDSLSFIEGFNEMNFNVNVVTKKNFYSSYSMIYSILQNLITNTIKYRKVGQANTVEINVKGITDGVQLNIKDSGIGMTKNQRDKVFDEGYRANSSIEGKGLGLHAVKEYVTRLNGEITVKSVIKKGTTFSIYFSI